MWVAENSLIQPGVSNLAIRRADDREPITFRQFFELCAKQTSFGDFISEQLKQSNYAGFFWELPPITTGTIDDPFECVVVDGSNSLSRLTANPNPFSNQFAKSKDGATIAVFKNLSGDATLIVPVPIDDSELAVYPHFAAFLREGNSHQIHEFWRAVGETALDHTSDFPFWLSTAGLGVSWLHLRLDSRPKYYRFQPYKQPPKL